MTSMYFALGESPDGPTPMPQSTDRTFGDYLKQELHARNWSVRYLAFRAGVNHSTISRLIRSQRTPRLETVQRLHQALKPVPPIQPVTPLASDPDAAFQRVADALALDPLLSPGAQRQLMRYYGQLRQPNRATPASQPGPTPSVRLCRVDVRPRAGPGEGPGA